MITPRSAWRLTAIVSAALILGAYGLLLSRASFVPRPAVVAFTALGLALLATVWIKALRRRRMTLQVFLAVLFVSSSLAALEDEWPLSIMFAMAAICFVGLALKKIVQASSDQRRGDTGTCLGTC